MIVVGHKTAPGDRVGTLAARRFLCPMPHVWRAEKLRARICSGIVWDFMPTCLATFSQQGPAVRSAKRRARNMRVCGGQRPFPFQPDRCPTVAYRQRERSGTMVPPQTEGDFALRLETISENPLHCRVKRRKSQTRRRVRAAVDGREAGKPRFPAQLCSRCYDDRRDMISVPGNAVFLEFILEQTFGYT